MSPVPRTGGPRAGDREQILELIVTAAEVFDTKAWDRTAEVFAAGADPFGRAQPPDYRDFLGEYTHTLRRTSSGWRIALRSCRPIAGTGSLRLGEP